MRISNRFVFVLAAVAACFTASSASAQTAPVEHPFLVIPGNLNAANYAGFSAYLPSTTFGCAASQAFMVRSAFVQVAPYQNDVVGAWSFSLTMPQVAPGLTTSAHLAFAGNGTNAHTFTFPGDVPVNYLHFAKTKADNVYFGAFVAVVLWGHCDTAPTPLSAQINMQNG